MSLSVQNLFFRKLFLNVLLLAFLSLFFTNAVFANTIFMDIPNEHWANVYINDLVAKGVVNGANPTYRGNEKVHRDEMAQLIFNAAGLTPIDLAEIGVTIPAFKDVPQGDWSAMAIYSNVNAKVVNGYTNQAGELTGYFGPANDVTREQVAKFVKNGFGWQANVSCGQVFEDVPENSLFYEFISTLYARKIVDGEDINGKKVYRGGDNTTRYEIAKIIANSLNSQDFRCEEKEAFMVKNVSSLNSTQVELCFNRTYNENTAFSKDNYNITNEQGGILNVIDVAPFTDSSCVLLTTSKQSPSENYNVKLKNVISFDGDALSATEVAFVGYGDSDEGDLLCDVEELSGTSTINPGTKNVVFLAFTCAAATDFVVIDGITFAHYGAGKFVDLDNISLYVGNKKLSTAVINEASNQVVFSGFEYLFPRFGSVEFFVKADVSSTAKENADHGFKLAQAKYIQTDASIKGSFPFIGPLLKITTQNEPSDDYADEAMAYNDQVFALYEELLDKFNGISNALSQQEIDSEDLMLRRQELSDLITINIQKLEAIKKIPNDEGFHDAILEIFQAYQSFVDVEMSAYFGVFVEIIALPDDTSEADVNALMEKEADLYLKFNDALIEIVGIENKAIEAQQAFAEKYNINLE